EDVHTPVVSDSLVQVKLQAVTNGVDHPATLTVPASSRFSYLDTLTNQQNATSTLYFYHPDHLGSSSWITTTNGTVKQHLHYLPWVEEFVNQRSSHFDGVRYTFSAKERDAETGFSYFGSRYFSSDLSIWLSVDPQASKYPSLSPYVYCADNPVKLVDPNGEDIFPDKSFIGTTYEKVHNYLLNNNKSYSRACKPFVSSKSFNLYLNCDAASIPTGKKGHTNYTYTYRTEDSQNVYPGTKYIATTVKSTESFHPELAEGDISLWHFYIVIHEMGHTGEAFNHKLAINNKHHNGFMALIDKQIGIWNELNDALCLGLSSIQIQELSMYGAEESSYFNQYIGELALRSGRTKDQEIEAYRQRIQEIFEKNSNIRIPNSD
ncbi:MAG: RHS repeat-associated core domain-containing protein, partial [Bacteroidales bacterium]|nr:RHS repeat-associated core domain-containing protein [Bacteroidales bacterium]